MAIEIKRVYKEHFPAARFIGKLYTNKDRINGTFAAYWDEWFQKNLFNELEKLPQLKNREPDYFGLMGCNENDFQYWIGMMLPSNTVVPAGYSYVDIPECDAGICWIYGSDTTGEIYGETAHNLCVKKLAENKIGEIKNDFNEKSWSWFFERYNRPRFTEKDTNGNVILDYGIYIK